MGNFIKIDNVIRIGAIVTSMALAIATSAQANVIADLGFVRLHAEKAVCIDKYECRELVPMPALHEALTTDQLFESHAPNVAIGNQQQQPAIIILPRGPGREAPKDNGPVIY